MRKLIAGLIAVGLLAVAAPSMAQTADPLGLIASGAVIPYVGGAGANAGILKVNSLTGALGSAIQQGSIAILEVASPVGSNAPPEENVFGAKPFHMFFFDQTCTRVGPSVGLPLTTNDSEFFNLNNIPNIPQAGLIAAAGVTTSGGLEDVLSPMSNPIHARVFWINVVDGTVSRVLEPISINNPEAISLNASWNPLRTGATFLAPLEGSTVRTTLYLACPTRNIIPGVFPEVPQGFFSTATTATINAGSTAIPVSGNSTQVFEPNGTAWINGVDAFTYTGVTTNSFTGVSGVGGVYPINTTITSVPVPAPGEGFPKLRPLPVLTTNATPVFLRVYDDEENFLRNIDIFCRCWGAHPIAEIDPLYSDPIQAPRGTYTEMEGEPFCTPDPGGDPACTFTGYRSVQWGSGKVGNDIFGRLSNGNYLSLRGLGPININFPFLPSIGGNILR
jgi:hypothetical protein